MELIQYQEMGTLNETPRGDRIRIAFFGLRNAGKSTLVNEFTGQRLAIVSDVPGTTTDPVSKAMEILPLGPCLVTDTAGLDDDGELGRMRVEKTLAVLSATDIAVWVGDGFEQWKSRFSVPVVEFRRGDSVDELKRRIAAIKLEDRVPGLLEGLVNGGDRVLCVVPIDESAPKGRLILPQQQVIRECLDRRIVCTVCQPGDIPEGDFSLVITDSQAFGALKGRFRRITSFSILFARQKGDLPAFLDGLKAIGKLQDGDWVLIAEACTHHRQCNDIGAVKIPKALEKLSGRKLRFGFVSGGSFAVDPESRPALVVHCGGCMLTRRELLNRLSIAKAAGVPVVNYGMVLAAANGLKVEDVMP